MGEGGGGAGLQVWAGSTAPSGRGEPVVVVVVVGRSGPGHYWAVGACPWSEKRPTGGGVKHQPTDGRSVFNIAQQKNLQDRQPRSSQDLY